MKFSTAYYFLLLYVTIICKPLIPYISDAASHFFDDAIHVATVHMIYGDNHVEIELAATGSADENNKNQSTLKVQEPVSVHISEDECVYDFTINNINRTYSTLQFSDPESIYLSKDAPPPQAV